MDHLKLKGDPKATRALVTNGAANDAILWSCAVTKINRKGKHQKRALLITNRHVLNLMPDNYSKCNRCIDLRSVHHLTTAASAQEFAIHVSDEYDYRFKMESGSLLDEVVKVLQGAFDNVKGSPLKVADMDVGALSRQALRLGSKEGTPSASVDYLKARAAPTHAGSQPGPRGGSRWPAPKLSWFPPCDLQVMTKAVVKRMGSGVGQPVMKVPPPLLEAPPP